MLQNATFAFSRSRAIFATEHNFGSIWAVFAVCQKIFFQKQCGN